MNYVDKTKGIKNFLKVYLLSLGVLIFSAYVLFNANIVQVNYLSIFLFTVIAAISLSNIIIQINKKAFSLQIMHWIFIFLFFFIAGFIQYLAGDFVYGVTPNDNTLNYALMTIIIWMISYYIGCKITSKRKSNLIDNIFYSKINYSYYFLMALIMISIVITLYVIADTGFSSLFSRSTAGMAFQGETAGNTLLNASVLRNFVLYTTVFTIIYYHKFKGPYLYLLMVQVICLLITNPILGMERFNIAIVYLGILILLFKGLRWSKKFIVAFFAGFVIIFPFLNLFRHDALTDLRWEEVRALYTDMTEGYLSGHYDVFSMLVNAISYVEFYGITYGYQLLGPIFFFIPRSIWPDKPLGTGYTIRLAQGETFLNVSAPLPAEAYINGAIVGVVLLALLFGRITSMIDNIYWNKTSKKLNQETYIEMIYPFLLSIFFFMNRGDLLSTTSFAAGHIFIFTVLFIINKTVFRRFK